jgi:hypothetical protein
MLLRAILGSCLAVMPVSLWSAEPEKVKAGELRQCLQV